jgi:hypothetical protein
MKVFISTSSLWDSICLTVFLPFSLRGLDKLVISIQQMLSNGTLSPHWSRSRSSGSVPMTSTSIALARVLGRRAVWTLPQYLPLKFPGMV